MKPVALMALLCAPVVAAQWQIALPIKEQGIAVGEVLATTDGMALQQLSGPEVAQTLRHHLPQPLLDWLAQQAQVTPIQLAQRGIDIRLDPQTLELQLALASESQRTRNIGFASSNGHSAVYSTAATVGIQHNLNVGYQHGFNDDLRQLDADLLGAVNLYGERGINLQYGLHYRDDNSEQQLYRTSTQLYIDNPEQPWRVTLGDVDTGGGGHLASVALGGIGWERLYQQLQPYKELRNDGSQFFELSHSAAVVIYVNGIYIDRLRLTAGRYNLSDLPLNDGANDIRIEIDYDSGEKQTLRYSQFYNAQLLRQGISDFGVYLGATSSQLENDIDYDDVAATAFWEYGVSDGWTLGFNGLYHQLGAVVGTTQVVGSDWGNVALRVSASQYDPLKVNGSKASIDYQQQVFGSGGYGSPNLRLSYEWSDDFVDTPWLDPVLEQMQSAALDYRWEISEQWQLGLYSYYEGHQRDNYSYRANVSVAWRRDGLNLTAYLEQERLDGVRDHKFYVNLELNFDLIDNRHNLSYSYDGDNELNRVQLDRFSENRVGELGYELAAEWQDNQQHYRSAADYNANRWRGTVELQHDRSGDRHSNQAYSSVNSSLVFADGAWGWGRESNGPALVISAHLTLGDTVVEINGDANGAEALATTNIGGVIPLSRPHEQNIVTVDAPNAPLGYSLGAGVEQIQPGSLTVHHIEVGSDAIRTVIATAVNASDEPIAGQLGQLSQDGKAVASLFTNRGGRFVIDGLAAGRYQLQFGHYRATLTVNETDPVLMRLPLIRFEEFNHENR